MNSKLARGGGGTPAQTAGLLLAANGTVVVLTGKLDPNGLMAGFDATATKSQTELNGDRQVLLQSGSVRRRIKNATQGADYLH